LAQLLHLTLEELLGQKAQPSKSGPTPRLPLQIDRISKLPKAKQHVVMEMLDMVITFQAGH
jgi:hypothetical protein